MIRFDCPLCGNTIKSSDKKAGKAVVCPECGEPSVAPAPECSRTSAHTDERSSRTDEHTVSDGVIGLFSGMSLGIRCAILALVGVCALALLLPLLAPVLSSVSSGGAALETATTWPMVFIPFCVVVVLFILYGQGTACPVCRKWFARTTVATEFVDREVFDKSGVPFVKSLYRTTYQCAACRQRWSAMQADEHREPARRRDILECGKRRRR